MPTDEEYAELVAKFDTLTKKVETLESSEEEEPAPKEDARDKTIARGLAFLKGYLAKDLPKEKLDAYSFNDLLVVAEFKKNQPKNTLNPAPPITKEDATKDTREEWMRPTVESR